MWFVNRWLESEGDARGPRPELDSSRRARSRSPSLEKEGTRAWKPLRPLPFRFLGGVNLPPEAAHSFKAEGDGYALAAGASAATGEEARGGEVQGNDASWMELVDASLPEG